TSPMPSVSRNGVSSMSNNAARSRNMSLRSLRPMRRSLSMVFPICHCEPFFGEAISCHEEIASSQRTLLATTLVAERAPCKMQKHRFEIRLADIHRADADAAFVGLGHHRR